MKYIAKSILFLIFILLITNCNTQKETQQILTVDTNKVHLEKYGFIADSLSEISGSINRNQTFSDILQDHNVPFRRILKIAKKAKDTFDVRKIRLNKNYQLFVENDSTEAVKYFVYEKDPVNYVVFDIADTINVYEFKKEVKIREKVVTGYIREGSSLFLSLEEKNNDPELAIALSEVFAWQINFFGIQKGDFFKAVYEEKFVDGKAVGIGRILSAQFNHWGEDYFAFLFEQDGKEAYFDENGKSLQKQFLKSPLKFSRISSGFSYSRLHPILKVRRAHTGIDYAAPMGTPVKAVGDGTVIHRKYSGAAGRYIKVKHNATYTSGYMHLSRYAKGISVGSRVRQGQIIGYVGSSGRSTGPHLDFRFWRGGTPINYLRMKFPPTHPVKSEYEERYSAIMYNWMDKLARIELLDKNYDVIALNLKHKSK
ncbi:MAG: peptidoglycan DD-metalloendopeptidase family protein [Rhodothermaceae bacterium]